MEAQQQQQYQYQYAPQPQNDTTTQQPLPSPYDPSQIQAYDQQPQQQPQDYYASYYNNQPQQQPQDYNSSSASYYYPHYPNSYPTHDPNSLYPPGVAPLPPVDAQQTHLYYPPPQEYLQPGQSAYRIGGSHGGRSLRGRGRGTFGHHGRGRGGGRGKPVPPQAAVSSTPAASDRAAATQPASSFAQGQAAPKPPSQAWCELCRVDCNSFDILEKHKSGKRHKRNLKVYEELHNLSRQMTVHNPHISPSQRRPENVYSNPSEGNQLLTENVASVSASIENKVEAPQGNDTSKGELPVAQPSEESVRKDNLAGRGGFKRKMRGGRGGKWMRAYDGSRRPVEPPKPKQVHVMCDLCNVKCESQVVYESHIAGKKHLSNVKRFQDHKEALGEGVQALYPLLPNIPSTSITSLASQEQPLYPTLPNVSSTSIIPQANQETLYPTLPNISSNSIIPQANQDQPLYPRLPNISSTSIITQANQDQPLYPTLPNVSLTSVIPQANQQGTQDAQALASLMLSQQKLPDPQAAQEALTQLLSQHGVRDAQTLVAQLVPCLLAQFQVPGSVPLPAVGMNTQNPPSQGPQTSNGAVSQNAAALNNSEQQNLTSDAGPETGAGMVEQPEGGQLKAANAVTEHVCPAP